MHLETHKFLVQCIRNAQTVQKHFYPANEEKKNPSLTIGHLQKSIRESMLLQTGWLVTSTISWWCNSWYIVLKLSTQKEQHDKSLCCHCGCCCCWKVTPFEKWIPLSFSIIPDGATESEGVKPRWPHLEPERLYHRARRGTNTHTHSHWAQTRRPSRRKTGSVRERRNINTAVPKPLFAFHLPAPSHVCSPPASGVALIR